MDEFYLSDDYSYSTGVSTASSSSGETDCSTFASGTRIVLPQPRHLTIFPRAATGTARMRRHVNFGHMIWMTLLLANFSNPLTTNFLQCESAHRNDALSYIGCSPVDIVLTSLIPLPGVESFR